MPQEKNSARTRGFSKTTTTSQIVYLKFCVLFYHHVNLKINFAMYKCHYVFIGEDGGCPMNPDRPRITRSALERSVDVAKFGQ